MGLGSKNGLFYRGLIAGANFQVTFSSGEKSQMTPPKDDKDSGNKMTLCLFCGVNLAFSQHSAAFGQVG